MFGGADELPDGFWRHSVAVAAGASIAARLASVPPGDALCAGLLHDLGAALCYRFDPAPYVARLDAGIDPSALLEAEARAYGGDHAMVGAFGLDQWKLPEHIVDAIRLHHHDPAAIVEKLPRVVVAGEALARAADPLDRHGHEPACDPGAAFAALGLTAVSIENLVQRTAEEAEALDAVLCSVR